MTVRVCQFPVLGKENVIYLRVRGGCNAARPRIYTGDHVGGAP
jgi:hypothetical protein